MFKKIIVGVDGSETSENAIRVACDISQKYGSEVHLVHTPHPQTVAFAMGAVAGYHAVTAMPSSEKVQEAGEKILQAADIIAQDCGQVKRVSHLRYGTPADEIIACANDCGADLIITGRRGLGSVGALFLGSTTQRVNHLAKCACLSVT